MVEVGRRIALRAAVDAASMNEIAAPGGTDVIAGGVTADTDVLVALASIRDGR
jgi:hypothetical protein